MAGCSCVGESRPCAVILLLLLGFGYFVLFVLFLLLLVLVLVLSRQFVFELPLPQSLLSLGEMLRLEERRLICAHQFLVPSMREDEVLESTYQFVSKGQGRYGQDDDRRTADDAEHAGVLLGVVDERGDATGAHLGDVINV